MASVVKEADAKKQGMPMNKFPKHTAKAGPLITLVQDGGNAAAKDNKAGAKPSKGVKSPSPERKVGPKKSSLAIKPKGVPASSQAASGETQC